MEDTLTPDLVDQLLNLTSPSEQHHHENEGPNVTDWTILDKPPDARMVTLTCHQHTTWVAQWNDTGTTDRVHTFTEKRRQQPHWHWLAVLATQPTTPTNPGRTGWPSRRLGTGQWMPQPQTPRCPRRGSLSLATWQRTSENTGHHGRNAGCPAPRTRNKPSNLAPPACKKTRTKFEVCTDPVRDKDRHTESFKTTTPRSQPPSRRKD